MIRCLVLGSFRLPGIWGEKVGELPGEKFEKRSEARNCHSGKEDEAAKKAGPILSKIYDKPDHSVCAYVRVFHYGEYPLFSVSASNPVAEIAKTIFM